MDDSKAQEKAPREYSTRRGSVKILVVAGARPNFMKVAPLIKAFGAFNRTQSRETGKINYLLIHTGQHYDVEMSGTFFEELGLPKPDISLEVGSGTHAEQTAGVLVKFEKVCFEERPDWVVVVGDVNSTMACALAAVKLGIKTAHVEAGLRSFDRCMPEEINRIVTDSISDILFTPSADADENLVREGIPAQKIKRVGNIMIDSLKEHLEEARRRKASDRFGVRKNSYVVVTLHRPSNVDDRASLSLIMDHLAMLSREIPVIFPMHPRTKKNLREFGLEKISQDSGRLMICSPLGYHDTIGLVEGARFVLTDSGGLQEETTFLNVPCLTLRPNTERPITITCGTNQLTCLDKLETDMKRLMTDRPKNGKVPELWDGNTAERIVQQLWALGN